MCKGHNQSYYCSCEHKNRHISMSSRGSRIGTASRVIAVPKIKQVGLSCTKMRVEIAAKLYTISGQYVMTINDYYYNYVASGVYRQL